MINEKVLDPSLYPDSLISKTFNRLTVESIFYISRSRMPMYLCSCSCGNIGYFRGDNLLSGASISCGCIDIENKAHKKQENKEKRRQLYLTSKENKKE